MEPANQHHPLSGWRRPGEHPDPIPHYPRQTDPDHRRRKPRHHLGPLNCPRPRIHLDNVPLHIVQRGHNSEPCFLAISW